MTMVENVEAGALNGKKKKVALLGTGVNPGFVLDRLPATLGSVVGQVERVRALRIVDAAALRDHLPADTPWVSPEQRQHILRRRLHGAHWRQRW